MRKKIFNRCLALGLFAIVCGAIGVVGATLFYRGRNVRDFAIGAPQSLRQPSSLSPAVGNSTDLRRGLGSNFLGIPPNNPRGNSLIDSSGDSLGYLRAGKRPATEAEALLFANLVRDYFEERVEHSGAATQKLAMVRRELVRMQAAGVQMAFNVLQLEDNELEKIIYKSYESKVAGAGWKATHFAVVCFSFFTCWFGNGPGPAALPEINSEFRRSQSVK